MAFLFKSKKNAEKAQALKEGANGPVGAHTSSPGTNGSGKERAQGEKGPVAAATPTSSVNNSTNSLQRGNTTTPSPEQANGRRAASSEQVQDLPLRNGSALAIQQMNANPNASLYPWSQRRITYTTQHPIPFPRYGAAVNSVASKEGEIYLMGGLINSSTVKGDLWMVEAGANMACYPLATTAEGPGPRVGHASLLVGNAFIVYGGDTKMEDSDVLDETLYLLNTSTRQWSRAVPAGPRPSGRYGHSLNILASKIYVFGGQVEGYFMNDLVAFDLNQLQVPSNRWEMLIKNSDEGGPPTGEIPPARTNHSVVTFNEKLYLFGGTNGFQWFNDVWCYDPIPNAWTMLDCIGYIPAPREGHAAAIVDDVMYIFGGRTEEGADLGDLAAFRISSRRWYTFQNMGPSPSPRSGHSMTAYGKQVIVLAGEPSTATREAQDLGIVYLLDTSKIRYPNDQQIQQTPSGERVAPVGGRRPSVSQISAARGPQGPPQQKQLNGPIARENGQSGIYARGNGQPGVNGNDMNGIAPGSAQLQGPQRASAPGPPPQQQVPDPRASTTTPTNGRSRSQQGQNAKQERGFGPSIDTSVRNAPLDTVTEQLATEEKSPRGSNPAGRHTPTQPPSQPPQSAPPPQPQPQPVQQLKTMTRQDSDPIQLPVNGHSRSSSRSKQHRGTTSVDSTAEPALRPVTNQPPQPSPPTPTRVPSNSLPRKSSARNSQTVTLLQELDSAKNRNAWYASELELARKAGYCPNPSASPTLDKRAAESFDDDDKPLIEALIAMKQELVNVQGSIDKQAILAAKKIAEVEKQRDVAVSEAVYARAKLAAHGSSPNTTPQPDSEPRDLHSMTWDRSTDISKKLAAALAVQRECQNKVETLTGELDAEKRSRHLAEEISNSSQSRMAELEAYRQQNSSEVERLRAELHECQVKSRAEAVICSEAVAALELLRAEKHELEAKHKVWEETSKDHGETFDSLREAVASSTAMSTLLERKLEEERTQREALDTKHTQLKAEHETATSELELATQRLRDAEELAEQHANEARLHKKALMSGFDRVTSARDSVPLSPNSEKMRALENQVEAANRLVRKYQAAADNASDKLRSAEERIAGLEAYQEQASREGMSIRKQLQSTMRESQNLQAANSDLKHKLANQQLESNAVNVQHNTLKDILGERGISPVTSARAVRGLSGGLTSPQSRSATPDLHRLRELEHQLTSSQQTLQETKDMYEQREQEAETAFREKLGQLENDYQSAVHYVKGTEKMLKRMKDELAKYKTENTRLKEQAIEADDKSAAKEASAGWESERADLSKQIETLQAEMRSSGAQMEQKLAEFRNELQIAQQERDQLKGSHEETQKKLDSSTQQARQELDQLQQENAQLERRAQDAETKVSLLLDQVEQSVDTYRRQSRIEPLHGGTIDRNVRDSAGSESSLFAGNDKRSSVALDSLANELETLRTQWETTNANYRLSNAFDFENVKGGEGEGGAGLGLGDGGLNDWRKRLDKEEAEKEGKDKGKMI